MPVTLPDDLTVPPKREIKAGDLMTMFQALADKFTAGIVDADLSPTGNFNGSKLATRSIPANRLVAADITTAEIGARQVKTANLDLLAVTAAQIANTTILDGKVKWVKSSWSVAGTLTPLQAFYFDLSLSSAQVSPVGVWWEKSGLPPQVASLITVGIYHDSVADKLYLTLGNPGQTNNPLAGLTFHFLGIYVS